MKDQTAPLVSVIVPVYNAERYLCDCLESICAQTYPALEMILVDDGSTDSSPALLRMYQNKDARIHVITGPNAGAPHARNIGIRAAHGEYLYFFDADDRMEPQAVENLLAEYQAAPGVKLAVGAYGRMDRGSRPLPPPRRRPSAGVLCLQREQDLIQAMRLNPFPDTKLYPADEIRKRGLWWRPVRIGQDVDFYLRYLAGCKGNLCVTQKCVARYRIVEGSISHAPRMYILEIKEMLDGVEVYAEAQHAPEAYFRELCSRRIVHYGAQAMKFHDFPQKARRKQLVDHFIRWAEEAQARSQGDLSEDAQRVLADLRKLKRFRLIYTSDLYHAVRAARLRLRRRDSDL